MKRKRGDLDIARRHLAAGRLDEAASVSSELLARRDDPEARALAAAIAIARERWEDALGHADAALAGSDRDAWLFFARARALLGLGQTGEARRALHRSRDLDPADPSVYELEAAILRAAGDLEGALHACDGAIALDPHRVSAYSLRADLLDALGRGDEAIEVLRNAVRKLGRTPEHHVAVLTKLAALLTARGEHDEAEVARTLAASVRTLGSG